MKTRSTINKNVKRTCYSFLSALVLVLALTLSGSHSNAQGLKIPQPSPSTTIKQDFGLSSVELSYCRPTVKGRKIFGDLVPYGKVWRTGANGATTLTFGDEVTIGGKKIPAGKYGLLSIPGENEWTIIISKQTDVTSPTAYKESEDVVRLTAKVEKMPYLFESFTIIMEDVKATSMNVSILWEEVAVTFSITTEIDAKIMSQIEQGMKGEKPPYFAAAYYYLENNKDLNKAVEWFDKALAENPKAFWVYHQKAQAQAKLGKKKDAIATANKSIELAKESKNADYVALNEKLIASLK